MSSSKRRRPRPASSYEPLLQSGKLDKPKPPPKPPLTKSFSSAAMNVDAAELEQSDSSQNVSGGYFQPGGGSSIGYCLSSVYKVKLGPRANDAAETSSKPPSSKLNFLKLGDSRPALLSLPAKFQVAYNERNKQSTRNASDSGAPVRAQSLSSISSVRRAPPPLPLDEIPDHDYSPTALIDPSKSLTKPFNCSESSTPSASNVTPKLRSLSVSSYRSVASCCSSSSSSVSIPSPTPSSHGAAGVRSGTMLPVTYAQPPPREMDYTEKEHPRKTFEYLNMLRHKEKLCDATLCVNNKELKAHRVVLAACSQYFESMFIGEFAEPAGEPVMIEEVSEDALEAMVEFAYTSSVKLTDRNVHSIFEAADFLQFTGVKGACFRFFKLQINKSNAIKMWLLAVSHNCTELIEASVRYMESNFVDIVKGREFISLDQPDVIMSIISREDLAITSEEQVYEAALAWIQYKIEKRKKHALEVFKCVRFPSIPKDYLLTIVDHEPLIQDDPDLLQMVCVALGVQNIHTSLSTVLMMLCCDQLIEALESHLTVLRGTLKRKKSPRSDETLGSMKPRAASMAIEVSCSGVFSLHHFGGACCPSCCGLGSTTVAGLVHG